MIVLLNEFVSDPILACIFNLSLGVYTAIDSLSNQFYNHQFTRFNYLFFSIYHSLFVTSILLSILIDKKHPLSILLLFLIPLAYKISDAIFEKANDLINVYRVQSLFGDKIAKSSKRIQHLDFFLRNMYQRAGVAFEDFRTNKNSIILEKIVSDHKISCQENSDCIFCNYQANTQEQFEQNFLDGKERRAFLKSFIRGQYLRIINSNILKKNNYERSSFYFSYFYYLIEVEKSKVLGYVEMIRLKHFLKLSIRESALLNEIFSKAKIQFETSRSSYSISQFNKQSQNNQGNAKGNVQQDESLLKQENGQINGTQSIENSNFFIGIQFDEELNRIERTYYETLAMKLKVISILSEDHIELIEFKKSASKLKRSIDLLRKDLQNLGNVHYNSHKVQYYMEGYSLHLGFGEKKRRIFKKLSRARMNNPVLQNIDTSIFDKDNCVIFISLIASNVGIVKRVQNKFENMFGIQIKDIIGRSINAIIPPLIAKYHDKMIQLYVQNSSQTDFQGYQGTLSKDTKKVESNYQQDNEDPKSKIIQLVSNNGTSQSQTKRIIQPNNYFKLLLARNHEGWGVPISLQFKVDCLAQSDCGITAHAKSIQSDYYYMMTSTRHFQIQLATQNIFDRLLSRYFQKNEISSIYLNRMIPLLHYFEKLWVQGNEKTEEVHKDLVKTIAFIPKQMDQQQKASLYVKKNQSNSSPFYSKLDYPNLQKELQKYSIEFYDMFTIKMKFYHYKNTFLSYNIIEIQQIRRIVSTESQRENLNLLKSQFSALLNIDYDISRDLDLLHKIDQLAGFQSKSSSQDDFKVNLSMQIDENVLENNEDDSFQKDINQMQEIQQQREGGNGNEGEDSTIQRRQLIENLINLKKVNIDNPSYNVMEQQYQQNSQDNLQLNALHAKFPTKNNQRNDENEYLQMQLLNSNLQNQSSSLANIQTGRHVGEEDYQQISYKQSSQIHDKSGLQKQNSDQGTYPEYNSLLQALYFQRVDENISTQMGKSYSNLQPNSKQDLQLGDTYRELPSTARKLFNQEYDDTDQSRLKSYQSELLTKAKLDTDQNVSQKQKGIYDLLKDKISRKVNGKTINGADGHGNNTIISNMSLDMSNTLQLDHIQGISPFVKQSQSSKQMQYLTSYYKTQPHISSKQEKQKTNVKKIQLEEEDNNYGMRKDRDGYSSDFFSNSAQKDEDRIRKEFEERSRILDASSVKTSQSHNHEHKKNIQRLIKSDKKDISIIILNIFGYLAIITIAIITTFEFFKIQTKLLQSKEDISLIPWANTMRISFSNPIAYHSMADLVEFDGFKDPTLYNVTYIKELRERTIYHQNQNKLLLQEYMQNDFSSKPYFRYINTNIMNLNISRDDKVFPPDQVAKYYPELKKSVNMTTQYFLENLMAYNFMYVNQNISFYEEQFYQKQQIDNFINFMLNLTYVQAQIQTHSKSVLYSVESEQQDLMSLVLIVAFILIAALFPLYYFVQYKNQIVLKLFATIPSLSLGAMTRSIQLAIDFQSDFSKLSKTKIAILNKADISQKKRKNISTTSSLPKFKLGLFFICTVAFILIIIQPIVNYILISQFNSEVQTNIDLLGVLYNLRAQIGSNLAVNYKYIVYLLTPQKLVYNPPYYAARLKTLLGSNTYAINNVTVIINDSQNQKKKQQNVYDNFFYELVNGNMCNALKNYPQYVKEENQIDLSTCSTIQSGILTKGFQISMKRFFEIFGDIYTIVTQKDQKKIVELLIIWQKSIPFKEFDTFSENLIKVLIIIKDFLLETMDRDLDSILSIQIILLSFQIVLLLLFFSLGWHTFLKFVYSEMIEIKQLLSIIQIDFIIDNPYIISYLTK